MINFGPGEVLRAKKFKHQYSSDSREWMEITHPDKSLVGVFLLLGFEKLDGTGERIDVNDFLRSCGWDNSKDLLPVDTEVQVKMEHNCGDGVATSWFVDAKVVGHVEGWYDLEFRDLSRNVVRPSKVYHESTV